MLDFPFDGHCFINGQFCHGQGAKQTNYYTATMEPLNDFHYASIDDVERAITAAEHGLHIWRNTALKERARILYDAANILKNNNDVIARVETLDTGKAISETLETDVMSGVECLHYMAAQAATLQGDFIGFSGDSGDFGYTKREPLGICVGIAAWNYPIQIACWKAAPALACGNAFIFKPAELTPLSVLFVADALQKAGLPDGVFQVLQGDGAIGAALITHPKVAKASLTGETSTGTKVMQAAAQDITKVTLELGGKSPLIIFDDANLDKALEGVHLANFYTSGQVCSNGTRVYVHDAIYDEFKKKIVNLAQGLVMGDPLDKATDIGPLASSELYEKVKHYLEIGRCEGTILCGGNTPSLQGFEQGLWVEPTVIETDNDEARIVREEIFGPVLTLLRFNDENDVIKRANDTPYGLAAGVYTQNLARAHRVIGALNAGSCWINTFNLTPLELPFGGYKQSGIGRENSKYALDGYSQIKSVYVAMDG